MKPLFSEDFLHFVWKTKQFDFKSLVTSNGQTVHIDHFGYHNHDAGPDFTQSKITIDGVQWIGNVEMHLLSSDWRKHGHQTDTLYDSVILHVVWQDNNPVLRQNGKRIPTISLADKIPQHLIDNYEALLADQDWIPCQSLLQTKELNFVEIWLDRLIVERLTDKTTHIASLLDLSKNDWDQACFASLAGAMGMKVNKDAFIALTQRIPLQLLLKYRDNLVQLEALLLGTAGFLTDECKDEYIIRLRAEYDFLKQKHNIQPMQQIAWKLARMRPFNQPTVRIAQLARVIHQHGRLFSHIVEANGDVTTLLDLFKIEITEGYWYKHYVIGKASTPKSKSIGKSLRHSIIINTVVPLLFHHGKVIGNEDTCDQAIKIISDLESEKNSIIDKWKSLGIKANSAKDSQALLQLKKTYCDTKRCLYCNIGYQLIKQT